MENECTCKQEIKSLKDLCPIHCEEMEYFLYDQVFQGREQMEEYYG